MGDMLVKLYDLADYSKEEQKLIDAGVVIREARAYEKNQVVSWVLEQFGQGWAGECDVAFSNHPVSCFIAVEAGQIIGFACYDSTCLNFFGPTGVTEAARGRGVGGVLLRKCLTAMANKGYAYAIIGGVGNGDIYRKYVGAIEIAGSTPGIYRNRLKFVASKT